MTPVYQPEGKAFQQALAWEVRNDGRGASMMSKDGGKDGFDSVLVMDSSRDATIFIVANRRRAISLALAWN